MPMYEYKCDACGQVFELIQRFSDEPLTVHEGCGGAVHRLISAPAFQFKGSGWYVNDYAKSGANASDSNKANADKPASSTNADGGKSEGAKSEGAKSENTKSDSSKADSSSSTTAKPASTADSKK